MIFFYIEYISTITGLIFIFFAVKEKPLAWVFGFISSVGLLVLYFHWGLIFNSALMFYYIVIAFYGFFSWKKVKETGEYHVKVKSLGLLKNIVFIVGGLVLSIIVFIFNKSMGGASPILDALTFAFAIIATYLQVKKYIDNWIYWIITNIVSVIMVFDFNSLSIVTLYVAYVSFAIWGFLLWKKQDIKVI